MEKLILIDGNSLLNRAYYAMKVFSTKDGLPTNGIFGFIKLVLKLIEDEKPKYFAVTFDLHEPTFRHKMYGEYKGTRKPMPEELVRQVPVLKETLAAMQICMVEKAGYEADDLIGTISKRFQGVETYIYTGDRDAYQLVGEGVNVCFTRKGVSDIDLLTKDNFFEKVGLTPAQIIEEKSIMGDSSDNIPGVRGIGPKGAKELLNAYGNLDGVYANLDKISSETLKAKLIAGKEDAYLSHTLATIDTNVPLDLTLEECLLKLPFSEEARAAFARLEFRSLLDSPFFPEKKENAPQVKTCEVTDKDSFIKAFEQEEAFSFCAEKDKFHVFFGDTEYFFSLRENFLSNGFFADELRSVFETLFTGTRRAILSDYKSLAHRLDEFGVKITCPVEDVALLRYLSDSNVRALSAEELAKDFALPAENAAYAIMLAYRDAQTRTAGSDEERLYREVELPLSKVLLEMERFGVQVDTSKFSVFSEKFNQELEALSKRIYSLAGVSGFNINSTYQLSQILFEKLKLSPKGVKKNARGGYSTSAEVLEKLAEEYEIAKLVLRYREIQKLLSTYIDGIRPLITGGVVHTTYNQTVTTTGRLSSANPNLQNIPVRREEGRELRRLFTAREGNVLIDADYSQIELRLLAHFSGCKPLIEAYNEGRDIHAATAAQVFGVPVPEVTPLMRRRAKTINFGIIYGMSAFGLAKDLSCSATEAQSYLDKYFKEYSSVKEYMEENVRLAKEQGYVTTILGRKRYIPEIASSNYNIRSFGERAAMNMPLQGSSADIIKLAMLRVFDRLNREKLQAKLVLQVHDELVLDAPQSEAERASALLKEEMEGAVKLNVPLIAEVSTGKSWYDAK